MDVEVVEGRSIMKKGQGHFSKLDGKEVFWYCCHECGNDILISDHTITHHSDGTFTVLPSLVCPTEDCTGHYHIRNSEIV